MRIIIEKIQGREAAVTITQRGATEALDEGEGVTTQESDTETASPQAAALEARDAGPAPAVGEAAATAQRDDTGPVSPQAAAPGDRDAGSVPIVTELTSGAPPLPLAAPGPDAAVVAGRSDDLFAGAAPGIPLEPPAVRTEVDTTKGDQ